MGVLFELFPTCILRKEIEGYVRLISSYSNEYRGSDGSSSRGREGSLGLSRLDDVAESSQLSGIVENSRLDGVAEKLDGAMVINLAGDSRECQCKVSERKISNIRKRERWK
jgi:hypothetical protein